MSTMTVSEINWADVGVMSGVLINWTDVAYMTGSGVNWIDMGLSSNSGINWVDMAFMTQANIDWSGIAILADNAQTIVDNIDDILTVADGLNTKMGELADLYDESDPGSDNSLFGRINLLIDMVGSIGGSPDMANQISEIHSRLGTSGDTRTLFETVEDTEGSALTAATQATTAAAQSTAAAVSAAASATDTQMILTRLGESSIGSTMFETLESAGFDADLAPNVESILTKITSVESYIGTETDDGGAGTVFGDLQSIINYVDTLEILMGSYVDQDTAETLSDEGLPETVFGMLARLYSIKEDASSAKNNAASAMTAAEAVRAELGASGMSETTYEKIRQLESALGSLRTAAETISESQVETGTVATEILDTLTQFVNQSSEALGIGGDDIQVESLTAQDADDKQKVFEKLDEINAKLSALKEAIEVDDVVVKTWFEAGDGG